MFVPRPEDGANLLLFLSPKLIFTFRPLPKKSIHQSTNKCTQRCGSPTIIFSVVDLFNFYPDSFRRDPALDRDPTYNQKTFFS